MKKQRAVKITATIGVLLITLFASANEWEEALKNGDDSQQAIQFARKYAHGWLSCADPTTGLLPRAIRQKDQNFWNSRDCAADNFPFIVLTGEVTGDHYLRLAGEHILKQEQALTNRVGPLPCNYSFSKQGFSKNWLDMEEIVFGASEYAKDGLMPITEWIGPSPYRDRMEALIRGIYDHARMGAGGFPLDNVEVHGELLQTTSRLYWITKDEAFRRWCFQIADWYLLEHPLVEHETIRLRDHGCEVINGLSEAYALAVHTAPERREQYRPAMYVLLDTVLAKGVDEDGMMGSWFKPATGEKDTTQINDNWGYVYNAFLTVDMVDNVPRYREAVEHALSNVHKHLKDSWEGSNYGADGYADTIEGAINLLNRLPVDSAFKWVDDSMRLLMAKQHEDGIIEGWYGDGNSARTAMMWALMKTQGVSVVPWRDDIKLGASMDEDGTLHIVIQSGWHWDGVVRYDVPRSRKYMHMPEDYPRINQFPEWFTLDVDASYDVNEVGVPKLTVPGTIIQGASLTLEPNKVRCFTIRPAGDTSPTQTVEPYALDEPGAVVSDENRLAAMLNDEDKLCFYQIPETEPFASARASGARETNPVTCAIDGNFNTRWSEKGDRQWLEVAFPGIVTIDAIGLAWYKGAYRQDRYQLDVSVDGSQWRTVFDGYAPCPVDILQLHTFDARKVRFIRIIGFGNNWNIPAYANENSIREVWAGLRSELVEMPTPKLTPAANLSQSGAIAKQMRRVWAWRASQPGYDNGNDWLRNTLFAGLMEAYNATGDVTYRDAALKWAEKMGWRLAEKRHADNHCAGQAYLELYFDEVNPERMTAVKERYDMMRADPKPGHEEWWWCDALFMSPPVLARLAKATGDATYLDYMDEMWWDVVDTLYDPEEHLFYRDDRFLPNPDGIYEPNGQEMFWGRGNGWVMAGLVRVLEYLPPDYPNRPRYEQLLREMAATMVAHQGDDGLWRASFLDPESYPEPETSASGLITYALAYGVRTGLLDPVEYGPVVYSAWHGLNGAVFANGKLGWAQAPGDRPAPVRWYNSELYAIGAYLMAGSEVYRIAQQLEQLR